MVTAYYSPHGGKVIAVLDARDADAEESLRASGVQFKRHTLKEADVPKTKDGGPDIAHLYIVADADGNLKTEVRLA